MSKANFLKTSLIFQSIALITPLIGVLVYYFYMSAQYDNTLQLDKRNAHNSHQALYTFKVFMKHVVDDASDKGRLSDNSILQLEKVKSQLAEIQLQDQSTEIAVIMAGVDNILIKTSLDPSLDMLVAQITSAHKINTSLLELANQLDQRAMENSRKFASALNDQFTLILIVWALTLAVAILFFYRRSKYRQKT